MEDIAAKARHKSSCRPLALIKQNWRTGMNAWLYQMALRKEWSPEDYRVEVWEGQEVTWPSGKLTGAKGGKIIPGDVIFLFFAQTHNVSPGIYGYAKERND
jgi:hypothetical protein